MMMWACTCGEWHPLATMDRCASGVPTLEALELMVDVMVDAPADLEPVTLVEFPVETRRGPRSRPASRVLDVIPSVRHG